MLRCPAVTKGSEAYAREFKQKKITKIKDILQDSEMVQQEAR